MTLEIKNITKKYKEKQALTEINLTLKPNTIYGLLGRNGAGKSSLLNIINNRSIPSSGAVMLDGVSIFDNEALLNKVYLMSEDNLFPSNMKIKDMYKISEAFYGSFDWKLATQMTEAFELNTKLTFKKLSTGYRSIAKLIVALSVPCDYIFLDEPVLGLDAAHRELFYSYLIETYEERSRSFIISTHLIEEISTLLENVIVINDGRVKVDSDVETLIRSNFALSGPKDMITDIAENYSLIGSESLGDYYTVYLTGTIPTDLPQEVTAKPVTLQNYFVQLTKRK
ncbi:ATP-binding cassette domain-containing protein [Vagococcus fluvialis]|uniref:ATP-binding cassette domain-containing protein n=1 Tax=Vagococcus fluvialis TaxID=2738 RepID=UPI001D09BBB7|nr:ABC transporter ATP-binding protein [Vagococcus fluvialis]UDM73727.1 ABC transporter ATP-binding protein [Vagococcus fluvialis]